MLINILKKQIPPKPASWFCDQQMDDNVCRVGGGIGFPVSSMLCMMRRRVINLNKFVDTFITGILIRMIVVTLEVLFSN